MNGDSCTVTVEGDQVNVGKNYTAAAASLSNSNYKLPAAKTTTFSIVKGELPTTNYPVSLTGYKGRTLSTVSLAAFPGWSWVNGETVLSTEQGTYAANYAGTDNYNAKSNVMLTVNVCAKAQKSLAVTIENWTYGDEPNAPTFTKPEGVTAEILYSKNFTGTPTSDVPTDAGTYAVAVKYETNTEIWIGGTTLTISKAIVTITAADKSAYVGSDAPNLSNPVLGTDYIITGLIGADTLSNGVTVVLTCNADMRKAGSYDIVPSVTGEDVRYDFAFDSGKLTVSNRPSSGSSSPTVSQDTTTNPDGSTTKTEIKSDGTVIETTKNTDGSATKTETKTETRKDDTTVKTVDETTTSASGEVTKSETTTTTKTDETG